MTAPVAPETGIQPGTAVPQGSVAPGSVAPGTVAPGTIAPCTIAPGSVAIVLSTFNGATFLSAQLDSFMAQSDIAWCLFWRDDGSVDDTVALMQAFAEGPAAGRCHRVDHAGHLGVTPSYMALLRAAVAHGAQVVAFSDQDDVWLPHKLSRSLAEIGADPAPALYCSRQVLVDAALNPVCESAPVRVRPGLAPALTQNIATGCTVMLNRAAAVLVASSRAPPVTLHDWWSYLVVAAAGGRIVADQQTTVLYRQHTTNAVGAPPSNSRRAIAALRRGPGVFMAVFRAHVAALQSQPELLAPASRNTIDIVATGLAGGPLAKLRALSHGLRRQTHAETALFRCWFLLG